ncbi:MAG: GNAT family N-acetyltransferase [Pseudomonas sp.]|nr:GNAT family N-acetyltransferase [Pseudomonas sp.]
MIMIYTEYVQKYRESAIELMCLLQDHERRISKDRPPSTEVSQAQLDYLVAAVANATGKIFIAIDHDRAVGLLVVFKDGEHEGTHHVYPEFLKYGLITDFVVAESHRGSSVAIELMQLAEKFCKTEGLSTIKLAVLSLNSVARNFYEKQGYHVQEIIYRKVI